MTFESQYLELIRRVIDTGDRRGNRTGTPSRSLFGESIKIDLAAEFPILQVRPVSWKTAIRELLWMIRGETNVRSLQAEGVHIWDAWADEHGQLGPVYGAQWRRWPTCGGAYYVDQLDDVIRAIHRDPTSRRLIVSAWNVGQLDRMALPPCHMLFQFYVTADYRLDCQMYQRSADLCVGTPFNAIGYATLTQMIAQETGLLPGNLTIVMGDCHVYEDQVELANQMCRRYEEWCYDEPTYQPPRLKYWKIPGEFFRATIEDFDVINYEPYGPAIKWPVAK